MANLLVIMGRIFFGLLLGCFILRGAEAPLQPVTVCEVLKDLNTYSGKVVLVVGRFSFRKTGRWLGEESCEKPAKAEAPESNDLWLAYEPKIAPKLSPVFEIDAAALRQKLKLVKQRTTLHDFRFGSADYDRWAVVYGRVEPRTGAVRTSPAEEMRKSAVPARAAAQLLYYGDGVIVFLDDLE